MEGCTYRLQFHAGFTFDDAEAVAPYLASLGVTHLYSSPVLRSTEGSRHGYDVVDPARIDEELGGEPGFWRLARALDEHDLGQILDIVPNHMAASPANRWWWDVLENGPASRYASYFDIDWESGGARPDATVLMPVLGDHYGRVLEAGELTLERDGGSFAVRYHDHRAPLSPRTLDDVVARAAERVGSDELTDLATALGTLPDARTADAAAAARRHHDKEALREELAALCREHADAAGAIDAELEAAQRDPDRLDALLRRQNFRLARWRTAAEELDYRRFFDIESLVALRVEDDLVFEDTHRLVVDLVAKGAVDGLRVDHVDGLRDPEGYLCRLRDAVGGRYLAVEKILEHDEELPPTWPVDGTTGYDFLNRANLLLVDERGEQAMTSCYRSFTGETAGYGEVVREAKLQIVREELAAEVERLTRLLTGICEARRRHRDHTRWELRETLRELLAAFPVYRTYVQPGRPVSDTDRTRVRAAVGRARDRRRDLDPELLELVGEILLLERGGASETELAVRFQQVSSPVTAKGVEDTALYRYHRLVSLNEVGGDPSLFGLGAAAFHEETAAVARRRPRTMLTLSTHDTKRSADVRARLAVLSELPDAWEQAVLRWAERNEVHRRGDRPDRNAEYLLYQTLVGAWPIGADRVRAFMRKAANEAKVHTSWVDPVPEYDDALSAFVDGVLSDPGFVADLEGFLSEQRVVEHGRRNSLSQTALLLTCPGLPDLYQGSELWDLSLVDPDNRRPVDFALRRRLLDDAAGPAPVAAPGRDDEGATKLRLVHRLLEHRRRAPACYEASAYEPLPVSGPGSEHVVAFAREGSAGVGLCVVVRRLPASLPGGDDTALTLPAGRWTDVLTGAERSGGRATAHDLLGASPVAVLERTGRGRTGAGGT